MDLPRHGIVRRPPRNGPELAFGMPIVARQCLLHRIGGRSTMGDAEGFKDGPRSSVPIITLSCPEQTTWRPRRKWPAILGSYFNGSGARNADPYNAVKQ